jgi:hypothetical protein
MISSLTTLQKATISPAINTDPQTTALFGSRWLSVLVSPPLGTLNASIL